MTGSLDGQFGWAVWVGSLEWQFGMAVWTSRDRALRDLPKGIHSYSNTVCTAQLALDFCLRGAS